MCPISKIYHVGRKGKKGLDDFQLHINVEHILKIGSDERDDGNTGDRHTSSTVTES